ncbi:MAG TPA: adenylosuccinate synthase [Caulifigura sp.]|nr:adenylosuccinate synthase [Caulifigura sp.]
MAVTAVVGLQWGDEAKGKIVDLLTDQHEIVVRYLGGNNAGRQQRQFVRLPLEHHRVAGVLRPGVTSIIANGVVMNPKALLEEMASVEAKGVVIDRLLISDRAHVIFPYHIAEEACFESGRGTDAIGTTGRGIGTCYRDKAGRTHAIRVGDFVNPSILKKRLEEIVPYKNTILKALGSSSCTYQAGDLFDEYSQYADKLRARVTDTTAYLHKALDAGKTMLFEAAQGSLLDIDHGTFPFVTSSNSSGCGIHPGSGVPERAINRMIGVVKAYTTRVGGGPCPTELVDEIGNHIREEGREYGTVTGRPRRCGWFDSVATSYGARISGVDCIAVMLLDVLSKLDELKICEAYEIDGERTTDFPGQLCNLAKAKPVYRTLKGWKTNIQGVKKIADFPKEARAYIDTIAELVGRKVEIVSVGPDRDQTAFL